jgi:hypothetical protein
MILRGELKMMDIQYWQARPEDVSEMVDAGGHPPDERTGGGWE